MRVIKRRPSPSGWSWKVFVWLFQADSKVEQELAVSGWWGWEEPFRQEEGYFQKL